MQYAVMPSETESEPFQESGSEHVPSGLDQPSTSRSDERPKRVRRSLNGATTREKRGRKRVRNESGWQRNVRKKLKASGDEHINSVKKVVPKRTVGAPCTCRLKCFDNINEAQRMSILTSFNEIGTKEKQDLYLGGLICSKPVERKRPRTRQRNPKEGSFSYRIRFGLTERKVCKKAFYGIHGVTKHRVDRLASSLKSEISVTPDMRGKHTNRPNKMPEEILQNIANHINSFPRRSSHYSRDKNDRKFFLPADLNISKMHRLYLEKYEKDVFQAHQRGETANPKVTYDYYNRSFTLNHNISFGTPRSDTCQTCDRLQNLMLAQLSPENKTAFQTEKDLHIRKSEMFYKKLKEVTTLSEKDDTTEVLCFDFQQNLPLPHVPAGDVFYKRQLWEYNFCIHSGKIRTSTFYMYDERTAKKGSNEVISFLNHYIQTYLPESVKKLYIFSDNAFAQNKNQTLMKYLFTLVNASGNISEIHHQYPEPGHSFLPCDRSFGLIEKNKRQKERIYLPSEWIKLVEQTSKKFRVVPVKQDMILNFSEHFKQLIKSVPKGPKKEKFAISTYRLMKYTKNNKFIECSVSSDLLNSTKFSINEKGDIPLSMPNNKAYFTPLDINPKKIKDLKDLVQKYVPLNDQGYYNRIFENITVDEEDPNSGDVNQDQDAENVSDSSYV